MAELTIQFLDVGQGDGIFIQFPSRATMLVDLGSTKNKELTSNDVLKYFREHTVFAKPNQELDYLILTHGDRDHFNMVGDFIEKLGVNVLKLAYGGAAKDYGGLIGRIKQLCPSCEPLELGQDFPIRLPIWGASPGVGAEVHVLMVNAPAPSKSGEGWRKNSNSIVLGLSYQGVKVILAGDATTDTEKAMLAEAAKRYAADPERLAQYFNSHVLKVGHHGSRRTSSSVAWIKAVRPRLLFISSDRSGSLDKKSRTGHRLPQTLTLGLIAAHSGALNNQCAAHNVVSAFDPEDYSNYNSRPDVKGDHITPPDAPGTTRTWWELPTTSGVFTSLVAMDRTQPEESDFDQGAQYQLSIATGGIVEVTSTYTPKQVLPPTSVGKL